MKKSSLKISVRSLALTGLIFFALASALLFTTVKPPQSSPSKQSVETNAEANRATRERSVNASEPADETTRQPTSDRSIGARQASRKDRATARPNSWRDDETEVATAARERTERQVEEEADEARPDQPDEADRWRRLRMVDENGQIPDRALLNAWEQSKRMPYESSAWPAMNKESVLNESQSSSEITKGEDVAGIQPTGWTWLGPGNVGGRIRSIIIHPTNAQILWVGSVSGGVWKSTNGGTTWNALNDFMANLAVSCMAIDATNPNVLYAGTGEGVGNSDSKRGAGIFKTTDGGTTWAQLGATNTQSFWYVNRLAINPNNSQIILAATWSGIWRSTDGGATWTRSLATSMLDVAFNPADATKCIASGTNSALYSTDGGVTWTAATGLPTTGRIEIAYARSNPSIVYAGVNNNSGEVWKSTDGGQSYTLANTGTDYLKGQGWYDNCIWVDPTNPNTIIVGGIDLWRSTDGGQTLTQISRWQSAPPFGVAPNLSAHADHHAIVESPQFNGTTNKTVFFGDDGGIFETTDVYNVAQRTGWTTLSTSIGITQFYGGAGNPTSGVILGGTQDNGTVVYKGGANSWVTTFGGDGGWVAADPTDPNYLYGEYVFLQIHRSTTGGGFGSSLSIYQGLTDAEQKSANFIAPFILDPNNPNTLLGGGDQLWRSTNVKATTPTWTAIKPSVGSNISAIAVAPGNSDIIWVGHNNGDVYYTTNGTSANPTWTQADTGTPSLPNRFCTRITIDPTNSSRVYVTFGGFVTNNVWRTNNNGASWTNVSGNLPALPVYSLVVWAQNPSNLYVGTEVGVYASADGGTTWSPSNDGPSNCSVDELFFMNNTLVAATHGRGMFSIALTASCTYNLNSTSQNFVAAGGTNTVNVTTTTGCAWTAASNNTSFININSGAGGTGNGTVGYTVTANTGAQRTGTMTVAGQTFTVTQDAAPKTIQLSASSYTVREDAGRVFVTVNRSGDTSATAAVSYATSDTAGLTPCSTLNTGLASSRCDYETTTGTLQFAAGQASLQIGIPIVFDAYAEGNESFTITLSNAQGATLGTPQSATITIQNVGRTGNPIDATDFFVGQHYIDFLGRVPDASYQTWQNIINNCPASGKDANGNFCDRIEVSADFFRSDEFQQRGYFIYRFYKFLSSVTDPNNPQFGHIPLYSEFAPDLAKVSGAFATQQDLDNAKAAFVADFMSRTEFQQTYGNLSDPTTFVTQLLQTAKLTTIDALTKQTWITGLTNGSLTRAQVLTAIVNSTQMSAQYFNEAFVLMEYFGYLRRTADAQYAVWINQMNADPSNYRAMVSFFLNSAEYRQRFGP